MAEIHLPKFGSSIIILSLLSSLALSLAIGDQDNDYVKTINQRQFGLKREKLTRFRVYWHDIYSGRNPTAARVVESQVNSTTEFGSVSMIDNPLTVGPELRSKTVGKAQGFYASAAQKEVGLLMVMNLVFTDGRYNGSTISVLGRNEVFSKVREMPVIGGSGIFRFARGYCEAKTHTFDIKTGDATVEYNIYVLHY